MAARGACAAARARCGGSACSCSRRRPGRAGPPRGVSTGLQQLGWIDGRNVRSMIRWAAGDAERASAPTRRNWLRSRPTSSWLPQRRPCRPLLQATRTVPIVFVQVADPVGAGYVESLARTGRQCHRLHHSSNTASSAKWLELLKEIAPASREWQSFAISPSADRDRPVGRHPIGGAVDGVELARSRCATPARSSAPSRHSRDPNGGLIVTGSARGGSSRADHSAGGTIPTASGLRSPYYRRPAAA